jgi:hypothetical protein
MYTFLLVASSLFPAVTWDPVNTFPLNDFPKRSYSRRTVTITSPSQVVVISYVPGSFEAPSRSVRELVSQPDPNIKSVGFEGRPLTNNSMFGKQKSLHGENVSGVVEVKGLRVILSAFPVGSDGQRVPAFQDGNLALKQADLALREVMARLIGENLESYRSLTLAGVHFQTLLRGSEDNRFVNVNALVDGSGSNLSVESSSGSVFLRRSGRAFQFAWGTPYAKMGGGWEPLPDGVALRNGQLWIPLVAAQRFLSANN